MPRFFMLGSSFKGGVAYIRGRDAEHIKVLRLRPGEKVTVCDGEGTDYNCEFISATKDEAELKIIDIVPCVTEPDVSVSLLCGLPKGSERQDYIIQKAVECGAHDIQFFNSSRCVARPDTPQKKLERWNRISEEAAKQSGRGIIPEVKWAGDIAGAYEVAAATDLGIFMYETGERERYDVLLEKNKGIKSAAIITGPEGGFEKFEADLARKIGLHVVSMGNRILRCETAPIIALSNIMFSTGNLS